MLRNAALSLTVALVLGVSATSADAADPDKKLPPRGGGPIAWIVSCENVKGGVDEIIVRDQRQIPAAIQKCRDRGGHPAGVTPVSKKKRVSP